MPCSSRLYGIWASLPSLSGSTTLCATHMHTHTHTATYSDAGHTNRSVPACRHSQVQPPCVPQTCTHMSTPTQQQTQAQGATTGVCHWHVPAEFGMRGWAWYTAHNCVGLSLTVTAHICALPITDGAAYSPRPKRQSCRKCSRTHRAWCVAHRSECVCNTHVRPSHECLRHTWSGCRRQPS